MTLSFPSEEKKSIFLGLANNEASVEGMPSISSWIVNDIFENTGLADDGSTVRHLIWPLYSGERSMAEILTSTFREVCPMTSWAYDGHKAQPLVMFASSLSHDWEIVYDHSSTTKMHMLNAMDSVVSAIELAARDKGADGAELQIEANHGRGLINEVKAGGWDMPAINLIDYLLSNWDVVGANKHSFALLGDLIEGSKGWRDVTGKKVRNAAISAELGYDYTEHVMNFGDGVCRRRKELAELVKKVLREQDESYSEYMSRRWGQ